MNLRGADISEQCVVTPHVVIVDRLRQQSSRALEKNLFRLGGFAEFVQTKSSMQESRAALRRNATELVTHSQCFRPSFVAHQIMQSEMQHFWTVLESVIDSVQFGHGFARHIQ